MSAPVETCCPLCGAPAQGFVAAGRFSYQFAPRTTGAMVDRFLTWRLPESVRADLCATVPEPDRYGTHLLTAEEARAMLEHVLSITKEPQSCA